MPGWLLKLIACSITALAAVCSSAYVSAHVKDAQAPLHPPVAGGPPRGAVAFLSHVTPQETGPPRGAVSGGHLNLRPSVQSSDSQPPLTFTSVS